MVQAELACCRSAQLNRDYTHQHAALTHQSKQGKAVKPAAARKAAFGRALRDDFLFDETWVNLNHGSFGTYPRAVRKALREHQDLAEWRPDQFIRYDYPRMLDEARAALAELVHAPVETVVFVPNATTAVNTVLRNLSYEAGDKILIFDTIYPACSKTVEYVAETTAAGIVTVACEYPADDGELVARFRRAVQREHAAGGRVKVALFDVVSSMPGLRVPFEALTVACRDLGVLSLIDGAHGVGHVPLHLDTLDCDFFVSNLHKWMFVPRGCSVFYVPLRNQHLMRSTLPTSHGFVPRPRPGQITTNPFPASGKSAFVASFEFVGTLDNSPYLCVPAAVEYRNQLGGEDAIIGYCTQLARQAGQLMAADFRTAVLENAAGTLGNCCFSNVRLPLSYHQLQADYDSQRRPDQRRPDGDAAAADAAPPLSIGVAVRDWLAELMVLEHCTFLPVMFFQEAWWVRICSQVYLELADFERAARMLQDLCTRAGAGEAWSGPKA